MLFLNWANLVCQCVYRSKLFKRTLSTSLPRWTSSSKRRSQLSVPEQLELRIMLSAAGPKISSVTPVQMLNGVFDHIVVDFDTAIDSTTFTLEDVSVIGPVGSGSATLTDIIQLDE